MSIVAIVNPIAGPRARASVVAERAELLRIEAAKRGVPLDVRVTERAGHAREIAAASAAGGATLVIVWGGDGTVNETGSALVGTRTALGLIPSGSGNGLAAALGVSRSPHAALSAVFDGRTRAMEVGTIAGRAFFNIAGVGFDARVARLFNEQPLGRRGGWPYVVIGVREGWRYRAATYDLQLDEVRVRVSAFLVAFANGSEYGSGARIAPGARMDDGRLVATVVADRSVPTRFWHAPRLAFGAIHRVPGVTWTPVKRAVIEADGPIEFHVDGESGIAAGRIDVGVLPGALSVRVPV